MKIVIAVLISVLISACVTKITAEYYSREILSLIDKIENDREKEIECLKETIRFLADIIGD